MSLATVTAHIPAGQSASAPVTFSGKVVKIAVPANWTDAPMAFKTSEDGGATYRPMYRSDGNLIQMPVQLPVVDAVTQAATTLLRPEFLGELDNLVVLSGPPDDLVPQTYAVDIVLTIEP